MWLRDIDAFGIEKLSLSDGTIQTLCEGTRSPLALLGSIVIRKSGASTVSDVIWQMTTAGMGLGECVGLNNHRRPRLAIVANCRGDYQITCLWRIPSREGLTRGFTLETRTWRRLNRRGDGVYDKRTVFVDRLVLPRTIVPLDDHLPRSTISA